MKFTCLSGHPNKTCGVIKIKDTMVMFDAPLDLLPTLNFLPLPVVPSSRLTTIPSWMPRIPGLGDCGLESELKECGGRVFIDSSPEVSFPDILSFNLKDVDVILISNHMSMLSLPFITELSDFDGVIFCTEPALTTAQMLMNEMINFIERVPKDKDALLWKNVKETYAKQIPFPIHPSTILSSSSPQNWRQLYTAQSVALSLSRVRVIGFSEKISLFGSLSATAYSSGHTIGSCNWVLETDHEKVVYFSSSSTLTTHPKPLDLKPLRNPDLLLLTNLSSCPTIHPDISLQEFCTHVKTTLTSSGNVLIPCYPSGIIYDLLECLVNTLDSSGFGSVPIFFISPVADQSLAYSNILAEWLTQNKQSRVYLPEEPFLHSQFVRTGRVKHFPSVSSEAFNNEYKTPCVVFTGHPSLRFGDVVHFIELWGHNSNNLIAFTEPEFPYAEALAPYQPLNLKVSFTPIDTSLNFGQANKVIQEMNPRILLAPNAYTSPPASMPHRNDLVLEAGKNPVTGVSSSVFSFSSGQTIKLPIRRNFARISLDPELSTTLMPTEVKPGVAIATVTGYLDGKDNTFIVKSLTRNHLKELTGDWRPGSQTLPPTNYSYGSLDLTLLMSKLAQAGLGKATLEHTSTGAIINIKDDAFITIENDTTTHIVCDFNSPLRSFLKELVMKCLKTC